MSASLKRLIVAVAVCSLGLSGFSNAGTGAPNPVRAALNLMTGEETAQVADATPTPTPTPAPTPDPGATPAPTPAATPEDDPDDDHADDDRDRVERSTEGCPDGFTGTHGQFVSQSDDKREAAHSRCGMPSHSRGHRDKEDKASSRGKSGSDK